MNEEMITIPKSQIEMLVLKSNIELLQRVNHLIDMIEAEIGKAKDERKD